MLFEYIFLLKKTDVSFLSGRTIDNSEFIVSIDQHLLKDKALLFNHLYNSKHRFCFHLADKSLTDENGQINAELLKFITSFIFLPNYIHYKGNYLFLLEGNSNDPDAFHLIKENLRLELKLQGINNIVFDLLDSKSGIKTEETANKVCTFIPQLNGYLEGDERGAHFENLVKQLVTSPFIWKKWIIEVADQEDYSHKIKLIKYFESWYMMTHPLLTSLKELYKNSDQLSTQLLNENIILKFKIQASNDYLKGLRESSMWYVNEYHRLKQDSSSSIPPAITYRDEIGPDNELQYRLNELKEQINYLEANRVNILNWYTNEYEVLPLWYKRVGHLIKAATGKRTFKSLFNK